MISYGKIRVPFLSNGKIKEEADLFRKNFGDNTIPVDIEKIIDLKLKLFIIPIPNFLKNCNIDALISSDYKYISVDKNEYEDERLHSRLRFSLAHEIGHFILHKAVYAEFNIKSQKDYYKLYRFLPDKQYSYLEIQASKFANYLLVPRERLIEEKDKQIRKNGSLNWFKTIDARTLNSYMAIPLSKTFKVSEDVILIALDDLNNV
jgi:Zn-dependent peptidase ImmA (M78 family)